MKPLRDQEYVCSRTKNSARIIAPGSIYESHSTDSGPAPMFGYPHHLDLTVSHLEVSLAFYTVVLARLGYQRTDLYSGGAPCWIHTDGGAPAFGIAIHEARNKTTHDRYSPGLHHLAFHAEERHQVDLFYEFLLENKFTILDSPAEYDYTSDYYAVFFADPDGLKLEVVHEPNATTNVA